MFDTQTSHQAYKLTKKLNQWTKSINETLLTAYIGKTNKQTKTCTTSTLETVIFYTECICTALVRSLYSKINE